MNSKLISTTAVLFALSGTAYAAGTTSFNQLDSNSDGYITETEAARNVTLTERWDTLDTNNDDRLDQSEFSAFEQMEGVEGTQQPMESDQQ